MATILNHTLGQNGTAVTMLGNWWLVGMFLLAIFVTFMIAYQMPAEIITVFIIAGFISISFYQIFDFTGQRLVLPVFILAIFIGFQAYKFFSK